MSIPIQDKDDANAADARVISAKSRKRASESSLSHLPLLQRVRRLWEDDAVENFLGDGYVGDNQYEGDSEHNLDAESGCGCRNFGKGMNECS